MGFGWTGLNQHCTCSLVVDLSRQLSFTDLVKYCAYFWLQFLFPSDPLPFLFYYYKCCCFGFFVFVCLFVRVACQIVFLCAYTHVILATWPTQYTHPALVHRLYATSSLETCGPYCWIIRTYMFFKGPEKTPCLNWRPGDAGVERQCSTNYANRDSSLSYNLSFTAIPFQLCPDGRTIMVHDDAIYHSVY